MGHPADISGLSQIGHSALGGFGDGMQVMRQGEEVVSVCPVPEGDFCDGAHCLHENRPGSYRSGELIFATYLNAGLRVYDVADASSPRDIAHWIPECPPDQAAAQVNDVWVGEDHLVYVTDRVNGGVYILAPEPELSARMTAAST